MKKEENSTIYSVKLRSRCKNQTKRRISECICDEFDHLCICMISYKYMPLHQHSHTNTCPCTSPASTSNATTLMPLKCNDEADVETLKKELKSSVSKKRRATGNFNRCKLKYHSISPTLHQLYYKSRHSLQIKRGKICKHNQPSS